MGHSRLTSLRVYVDAEVATKIRRAARDNETSVSSYLSRLVHTGIEGAKPVPDRTTVVLEYQSIQLDLLLSHLSPELKKKAREVFRARTAEATLPLGEAGNAV